MDIDKLLKTKSYRLLLFFVSDCVVAEYNRENTVQNIFKKGLE